MACRSDELGPAAEAPRPALFASLAADGRFRRDTRFGRVLHPGTLSYREARATDSVHVVVDGHRVSVHLDRMSPLAVDNRRGIRRYAPVRVLAHAVVDLAGESLSLLRGHEHHRHELTCERVWVDDGELHCATGTLTADNAEAEHGSDEDDDLLEVPFNVADEAVHLLDSDIEPWSIHLEVRFEGRLDDERLRMAVIAAVGRHPLARARKGPWQRRDHQHRWLIEPRAGADPLEVVDCPDDDSVAAVRAELQSHSVPLDQAPPLRLRLAHTSTGDVLMLNANHAATDGFGALRFLRSVGRAYADRPDPVPDLDLLGARNLTAGLAPSDLATRVRRQAAVLEKLRDLVTTPARLAPAGGTDRPGYGFHLESLSETETRVLGQLDHPTTTDDVLLAALNLAVAGWNKERGRECRRVSVLAPANLRPRAWRDEMVGNFTLMARVSTSPRHRRTPASTLRTITTQTRRKRRTGMGTALLELLGASPLLPLWVKNRLSPLLAATGNRLVDTAILANLGQVETLDFGEAGPATALHFSAPGRMPCGLSIGAVTSDSRLHLAFRFRHPQFDDDAARRFAERFLTDLRRLAAETYGASVADAPAPAVASR